MIGANAPAAASSRTIAASSATIDSLWQAGATDAALSAVRSAAATARAAGDSLLLLDMSLRQGRMQTAIGRSVPAVPALETARELALALGDTMSLLRVRRWYAVALWQVGREPAAAAEVALLLQESRRYGDTEHEAWALGGLAYGDWQELKLESARQRYTTAAALHRANGTPGGELFMLNGLGMVLVNLGEFEEAVDVLARVSALAQEAGRPYIAGLSENNLGALHLDLGDADRALVRFRRAEELMKADRSELEWIYPAKGIAVAEARLGHFESSVRRCEDLLDLIRARGSTGFEADIMFSFAEVRIIQGRLGLAESLLSQITDGMEVETADRMESLYLLSRVLIRQDRAAEAVEILRTHETWARQVEEKRLQVMYALALGDALVQTSAWSEARTALGRADATSRELGLNRERLEALALMAEADERLGVPRAALADLEEAAQVWRELRTLPREWQWREQLGATTHSISTSLARLYLDHGPEPEDRRRQDKALAVSQFFKARTLQERMRGPGPMAADSVATVDLDYLQTTVLHDDEILLDFLVGRHESIMFAVTSTESRVVNLPSASGLDDRIDRLLELILIPSRPSGNAMLSVPESVIEAGARALAGELLGPVADLLSDRSSVIFVPDGSLHRLPLPLLLRFMSNNTPDVCRVPSVSILAAQRLHRRSPHTGTPDTGLRSLVVGGGRRTRGGAEFSEAALLEREYLGVSTELLRGAEGEPAASELIGYDLLHFATHATVNTEYPWRSAINLSRAMMDSMDHAIEARQVAALDLNARLAVLAGCESASGRVLDAEGVLGLGSAFLAAGTPTVVAALWPVDDMATARLMVTFYDRLAAGHTVSAALRQAQQAVAARDRTSHPFFWSGFVVLGEGSMVLPLGRRTSLLTRIAPIIVLVSIAVIGFWFVRRAAIRRHL
ncbi:MAG: CHAT domain-containing protein [bacterium]|nr:CHAT domain-containing protein [bacterium]